MRFSDHLRIPAGKGSDLAGDLPNHPPEMQFLALTVVRAANFSPLPLLALVGQAAAVKKHQPGTAEVLVKQQLLPSLLVQSCPDCPKPILKSSWLSIGSGPRLSTPAKPCCLAANREGVTKLKRSVKPKLHLNLYMRLSLILGAA